MEISRKGILCRSTGSEYKLVRVQTGWEVVFDVLANQFLKALYQTATRQQSRLDTADLFTVGTGKMVETLSSNSDVKSQLANWYVFLVHGQGPAALLILTLIRLFSYIHCGY